MFKGIIALLGSVGSIVNKLLGMKERKEHRQAGANEEILSQREDVEDAKKRMDDTPRSGRGAAIKRLRGNKKI